MSLPPAVARAVEEALGSPPVAAAAVGGGSIASAARVLLADGRTVFVKHDPGARPGAFGAEAAGLRWIAEAGALRTPEVLALGDDEGDGGAPRFLALEWIDRSASRSAQLNRGPSSNWATPAPGEEFGRRLAALHRFGAPSFGLGADNAIGPIAQDNRPCGSWAEFYGHRRLVPLARRAAEAGRLTASALWGVEALAKRLPDLCGPAEPPARLHGDLWSGNAILDARGGPVVVDPAVYGGHREMDLAMMRLFGGFPEAAHAAYREAHPLADGHEDRVALCQLYPLLVHVHLFGGGYAASVGAVLRRYSDRRLSR